MKTILHAFIYLFMLCAPKAMSMAQLNNPGNIQYDWKTDTANRNVKLSELAVVLPRHSFPSIDYPEFIGKEKGKDAFFRHEPVISVAVKDEAKAYPLNMLTMHEISNDSLGGIPILATYCPLCNSSEVYDRRLNHKGKTYLLEFEVSGMLRNSDMVMADKQTETWWQQLIGLGLVGKLADARLEVIPSMVLSVHDFFERYPDGKILSPDTGTDSQKRYGTNPYVHYDDEANKPYARFFDPTMLDARLPPMERVIDLAGKDGYRVYPFSKIAREGVINDVYDGMRIVIFYKEGAVSVLDERNISDSKSIGSATMFSSVLDGKPLTFRKADDAFTDNETGSVWDITGRCVEGGLKGRELMPQRYSNHFAFAWLTFHPESEIYGE